MLKVNGEKVAYKILLACIGMSILTLPLALLQKVSIGSIEFSASYLFMGAVLGWIPLRALLHLPKNIGRRLPASMAFPLITVGLVAVFGVFNGFDVRFLQSIVLWVLFTFLGMQMSDEALIERFSKLMCWLGAASAILGIALYSINIPLIDLEAAGSDQYFVDTFGHYRASSIFLNPNSFAYFLMFYICFSFFGNYETSKRSWLVFACVAVAFLLSGSRSAMAALGFLLLLRIILLFALRFRFPLLMAGNVALVSVLVALIAMADLFIGKDIRFEKWSFSLDIFFRQMQRVYLGVPENIPLEKLGLHFSDNMFLTILFKLGGVGAAIFATYYLFIMFRAIVTLAYGSRTIRPFAAYFLGSTVLFFYSNFLYFYPMVLIHGVATGLLLVRIQSKGFSTSEHVEAAR
jgi:hypothetical protein